MQNKSIFPRIVLTIGRREVALFPLSLGHGTDCQYLYMKKKLPDIRKKSIQNAERYRGRENKNENTEWKGEILNTAEFPEAKLSLSQHLFFPV